MASPAQRNRPPTDLSKRRIRKRRTSPTGGFLPIYQVEGDPVKALARLQLPPGTEVAIIPSTAGAAEQLQQAGLVRSGRVAAPVHEVAVAHGTQPKAADPSAFEPDARARALLRGVRIARQDLHDAGGSFELDEVRELLGGISPQAVSKRVREGALLAVPGPSNRRRYPTLQFKPDGSVVEGLREVRAALPSRNAWVMLNFLANPDDRLQKRRPIDVLKAGDVDHVVASARRFGEQGA